MNNTLNNGFMILEYLAGTAEECSVKELAEHFKLPNSHVCRLLKTLAETGYVLQTPGSRKYRVGLKILTLAHARLTKITMRGVARPYMRKLADDFKCPVFLAATSNGFSMVVGTEYPDFYSGDAGIDIGQIHIVNRSACGKVCAAYATPEQLAVLLEHCDWRENTPRSITTPEGFLNELAAVRNNRYAVMRGENNPDVGAVGAPVFNVAGELVGALGIVMPHGAEKWSDELWERTIARTRDDARSISFALGYPL